MSMHDLGSALLRHVPAESAHQLGLCALRAGLGPVQRQADDAVLRTQVGPLRLPNPIGLAAGFDKNAQAGAALLRAGFGWVECGTVTPLAQTGNTRPRLFRLRQDGAVINRMGFNNAGLERFRRHFAAQKARAHGALGANLGANKDSADRAGDYVTGLRALWGLPDWFTINVSSPNTPGLRALQGKDALEDLLGRLMEARLALAAGQPSPPLFLKLAPDLNEAQIAQICSAARAFGIDGLIIGNTTLHRPAGLRSRYRNQAGGLSGRPLMARSTAVLRDFAEASEGALALVGVGGIASGADAFAKIRAGASAVQLYTALIYHGPSLVQRIKSELAQILRVEGFASVQDAVG